MSEVRELPATAPVSAAPAEDPAVPAPAPLPQPLADCSAAEQAERRYLSALNPLLKEAWEQREMEVFVDTLAWTLARVIAGMNKPYVTGDILRRLGKYTCDIDEANRAAEEAETAKKDGHVPH
jgi:hypothetical protein